MASSNDDFSTAPDDTLLDFEADSFSDSDNDDNSDISDISQKTEKQTVELGKQQFPEIEKRFEAVPHQFFTDPGYYKTALSGEGDIAQRLHSILQKYLGTKDPKDRSVFRAQLITAYWEFLRNAVKKATGKIPESKKLLLRFNILHPNFIDTETKEFFAKLVMENELKQPVYYVDEWLKLVGTGAIKTSTTDEVRIARNNTQTKMRHLLEKATGKYDGVISMLKAKSRERTNLEEYLQKHFEIITEHFLFGDFDDVFRSYSEGQKRTIAEIQDILKNMLKNDRELDTLTKEYLQAQADVEILESKVENEGDDEVTDFQAIDTEFETIKQAAKMCVGRQGNHYPVLSSEYFHSGPNDIGFRENIISMLTLIESIDPEAFYRSYKNQVNRIPPFVVLIPSYGDSGICWEPFDKHNRATSRGRVIIPMYPKNLYTAILSAVADLRWQVAKEKASYYWMEEGLTGNYYQWFTAQKIKGDVKDFFIQDYILWMTKESDGIQKLDKDVRGTFWRFMPFSKEIKEKLKTRSFVYQELCQRDKNREMSDGY